MIKKISHIGIAVKNIDETIKLYSEILGLKVEGFEEISDQKVKIAFIVVGESRIELLESTDMESSIAKFIEARGEGIHHIALEVDSIEAELEKLKNKGIKLIDEKPRIGAHHTKIAFIHPKSTSGTLLELCEPRT